MPKVPTTIEITDLSTKWGLVVVIDESGAVVRETMISAAEAEFVKANNRTTPPGCTDDEWHAGRAMMFTRPCLPGQAVINPGNVLMVNYGIEQSDGRVRASVMAIPEQEWSVVDGVVCVAADVVADMPSVLKE